MEVVSVGHITIGIDRRCSDLLVTCLLPVPFQATPDAVRSVERPVSLGVCRMFSYLSVGRQDVRW